MLLQPGDMGGSWSTGAQGELDRGCVPAHMYATERISPLKAVLKNNSMHLMLGKGLFSSLLQSSKVGQARQLPLHNVPTFLLLCPGPRMSRDAVFGAPCSITSYNKVMVPASSVPLAWPKGDGRCWAVQGPPGLSALSMHLHQMGILMCHIATATGSIQQGETA